MLVWPTAPSPRRRTLRLTWLSTMATPSHARAALITVAGSMSALRIHGSAWMQAEARTDEPLRDCVGLGQEGDVAVPLRERVCVGLLELPHGELQLPRQSVHVAAFDHRRQDRMLASDHDDLPLPEPELLERPATIVERVAHEFLEDDQHAAHDVAVMHDPLLARPVADQHAAVVHQVQVLESRPTHRVQPDPEDACTTEAHRRGRCDVEGGW